MKINIEIELSAQEARDFFGLPDVRPLQQELMKNISDGLHSGAAGFDALSLMKPLFPAQMQSLESLQKAFWDAFQQDAQSAAPTAAGKKTAGRSKKSTRGG